MSRILPRSQDRSNERNISTFIAGGCVSSIVPPWTKGTMSLSKYSFYYYASDFAYNWLYYIIYIYIICFKECHVPKIFTWILLESGSVPLSRDNLKREKLSWNCWMNRSFGEKMFQFTNARYISSIYTSESLKIKTLRPFLRTKFLMKFRDDPRVKI